MNDNYEITKIKTGIDGLDEVLYGGLIPRRSYLLRGGPGTGKTTLGMQFLMEGIAIDEKSLLITLSEDETKLLEEFKNKFGATIGQIHILDLSPSAEVVMENQNYNLFSPHEVEWEPLLSKITSKLNDFKPSRIFFDGITQLKYISNNQYEFRKNILSLINYTRNINATTLISSESGTFLSDEDMQFMCDGIINLEYTHSQRNLTIKKYRNSIFLTGDHTIKLTDHGMKLYPVLQNEIKDKDYLKEVISSGIDEIDRLLKGGIERGTSSILSGPSGVGKTTLGIQLILQAAKKGENSIIYTFEENISTIVNRCEAINIPIKEMIDKKSLTIKSINPVQLSPNEFSQMVKKDVLDAGITLVMIDSITGFKLSFSEEIYSNQAIIRHLHILVHYLTSKNVTVILINEIQSIMGDTLKATDYGVSYLADNIILLRYLEINGKMEKAIGVLKKRLSDFEKNLRQFKITEKGIIVGEPLIHLRGILTGNPEIIKD